MRLTWDLDLVVGVTLGTPGPTLMRVFGGSPLMSFAPLLLSFFDGEPKIRRRVFSVDHQSPESIVVDGVD